jgi:LPS export ABC transporter protein LptC
MNNKGTRDKAQGTRYKSLQSVRPLKAAIRYSRLLYFVPFAFCLFLWSCENSQKEIDALTSSKPMIDEARIVESYISQNGKIKAKLTAPLMIRLEKPKDTTPPYIEFPKALHSDFFDDSSRIETWVDSKYGKYFETLNKVYLRDSVVVINVKGDTLRTDELWWDQNTQMFYTDKLAVYHGINKAIAGGKGMTATQDLSSVIFKEPTGTVKYNENGGF